MRPLNVSIGHFSTGGTATTRTSQQICEAFFRRNQTSSARPFEVCPSSTRTNETVVVLNSPPQLVDVDYHIDPEDQFRYNYEYPPNI